MIDGHSHALGWVGIIAGGLCAAVAAWPLVTTAWNVLGLADWQTWRLVLFSVGAVALAAGVVGTNWKRTSPIRLIWLILAAWLMAAVAIAALTGLAWLLLDGPAWKPPEDLTARHLEAITTRAFAMVAGLGGVALLVIAYRRQRTTEAGEQREVTKLFNERFTAAYTELGSEHAAVRLGAVHALAHLADDAPSEEEVQMVIDVLCAYLRMPYTPKPEPLPKNASRVKREEHHRRELEFTSYREVRHTIIRIIGNHLREPTRWRGKNFDFTGAVFDGGDLSGAAFPDGITSFAGAEFVEGEVNFSGVKFSGGLVDFYGAKFSGSSVRFGGAEFSDSSVSFARAEFTGGKVLLIGVKFIGGHITFTDSRFTGSEVKFTNSIFTGSQMGFYQSVFSGGLVDFDKIEISDGMINFLFAVGARPAGLLDASRNSGPLLLLPKRWSQETLSS
ncbi:MULTISPECIES: pentapeptide repeat-containing protein [Nocardiopsidaceae]|uniref:Pentapeptide repeat-containing protein n=1 Tax=Streptomonospora nanhaiensis TaxID=1323731 RepID=A0ABY6YKQ3_9ACTN|nr:pentapeptide repeat-containing protein [Streptomonospora nanhaiensis]WAE72929.1 pentapeptide repeat-containing protein [Streptomonospora nanhaiensis]